MLQATMTRPAEKNGMMIKTKREPILRVVPRPGDINANGHIFCRWVLSQMDITAGSVASYMAPGSVATVALVALVLNGPIIIHQITSEYHDIARAGRTSKGPPIQKH